MWKNNLDKRFDGVEECYICLSIVHQDINSIPKITCRTCKKKFHGPCLVSLINKLIVIRINIIDFCFFFFSINGLQLAANHLAQCVAIFSKY